jgi:hypothetical protein
MKALVVLVAIYVGAFFIAIQGASPNQVEAAPQTSALAAQGGSHGGPAKEADIRSLLELVGARDLVQDATTTGTQQFRESLTASLPESDRAQQIVNTFVADYQNRLHADDVTSQLVAIYDRYFTDDEIKGLVQFYGSPLGQKVAAETPKFAAETQAANRAVSTRVAKEVLQDLRRQYPGIGAQARLVKPRAGPSEQARRQPQTEPQMQPQTQPQTQP